ncbi:MAG: N-acetyltransferase [Dehalococcoidales bacterium]|nr:GNAT family N-acetyltransferase [Dehalococcoidales bacterium]MDP6042970.1 N-acetyltransferase [Dehalococcoidales bacterium]MDP6449106.1 N-acetyltransferase [Dehalococcoidales bacterium]MDP6577113.1 N-acetyltransferase [Dehalococcoidales bacterium]MDP6824658.1 N-acetyltransferase [Dehalococcoidales bacterium]
MGEIEKAKIQDVPQIHRLINHFADKGEMLGRPLSEIYENIRDYFVIRQSEQILASAALHICWADLAEIRSVVVAKNIQQQGIGTRLVEACFQEARELGIATVFCLTYQPSFFEKLGFYQVDRMELPRKVWTECYRCPKFPDCDEVALTCTLEV